MRIAYSKRHEMRKEEDFEVIFLSEEGQKQAKIRINNGEHDFIVKSYLFFFINFVYYKI